MRGSSALLLVVGLAGCIGREGRGVPLYGDGQSLRPRGEVARLVGPIAYVDGRDVTSLGGTLELLPGCHVVEIGGRTGQVDIMRGGWAATLPNLGYAFRMQGGHSYVIELRHDPTLGQGPQASGRIVAYEQDPEGSVIYVPWVRGRAAVEACRQWTPPARAHG